MESKVIAIGYDRKTLKNLMNAAEIFDYQWENFDDEVKLEQVLDNMPEKKFVLLNLEGQPEHLVHMSAKLNTASNVKVISTIKNNNLEEKLRCLSFGSCMCFVEPLSAEEVFRFISFLDNNVQ